MAILHRVVRAIDCPIYSFYILAREAQFRRFCADESGGCFNPTGLVLAPRRSQRLAAQIAQTGPHSHQLAPFQGPAVAHNPAVGDSKLKALARDVIGAAYRAATQGLINGSQNAGNQGRGQRAMACAAAPSGEDTPGVGRASKRSSAPAPDTAETHHAEQQSRRRRRGSVDLAEPAESGRGVSPNVSCKATGAARRKAKAAKALPSREMEARLWQQGFQHVAGVDEAGRGPLAGPVVAAACVIPEGVFIEGVNDSKRLREDERERLFEIIISTPGVAYAVHVVEPAVIDEVNILQAAMQAMAGCLQQLWSLPGKPPPDYILVDGNRLPDGMPSVKAEHIIKGDSECYVIAAASILAKVTRDRLMLQYDEQWPLYGFKAHKGYGTAAHIAALLKHGPCDIHRRSFAPIKDWGILGNKAR